MKLARLGCGSIVLAAFMAVASCGGDSGPSPEQGCKDLVATLCNKIFDCYTAAELAEAKDQVGNSKSDCATKLQSAQCTSTAVMCDAGKTYHADKAQSCLDQIKAFSCTDIKNDTPDPAICDQVCQ